jgi:hypothetical protein
MTDLFHALIVESSSCQNGPEVVSSPSSSASLPSSSVSLLSAVSLVSSFASLLFPSFVSLVSSFYGFHIQPGHHCFA